MNTYTETFVNVGGCINCGVQFTLTQNLYDRRRDDGKNFHCPNGHAQCFGNSLETRLENAKNALARERARRDQAEASAKAQRGAATRARNERDRLKLRVSHGVCPCCHRTFKQLSRHMENKHPDYPAA